MYCEEAGHEKGTNQKKEYNLYIIQREPERNCTGGHRGCCGWSKRMVAVKYSGIWGMEVVGRVGF